MDQQVVVFQIGPASYGIDIARVQEIRVMSAVTAVPNAPEYVKGMLNLRGKIAPVVDMHTRFGQAASEDTRATRIIVVTMASGEWVGLVVDGVSEVVRIPADTVEAPSALVTTMDSQFISGIAKVTEEHLVILLDLDVMLQTTMEMASGSGGLASGELLTAASAAECHASIWRFRQRSRRMTAHSVITRNRLLRSSVAASLLAVLSACGASAPAAKATATRTATPTVAATATPTRTPVPTSTPAATATSAPAVAATEAPPPAAATPEAIGGYEQALERLRLGNRRYAEGQPVYPNLGAERRAEVAKAQKPYATVFGCVDSRVPPELLFDCGLGELFVIRTAGHVLDNASLGSIQFGIAELGIPLLLVLGHERCGAVKATVEMVEKQEQAPGMIAALVEGLTPAFELAKDQPGDVVENCVRANTELTVSALRQAPIVAEALAAGTLAVVGGRYDLDSGVVDITVA